LEKHPPVLNLSSQPPEPIAMLGLSAAPSSDYIPPSAGMITMKGPNGKMETVSLIELVEKQAKRIQQLERQLKEKNAQLAKTGKGGATLDPVLQAQLQQSLREGEVLRQSLATLQAQVNQLQQAQQKAPALPAPTVTALPPGEPFTMATLADTPVTEPAGKPIVPSRVITQKTPLNKKWYNPFPAKKPPFSLKPPSPNKGAEASEPVTMMGVGAAATPAKTTVAEPPMPSWMKNAPPSADSIPLEPVTLGSLETQKPEPLPQEKGARSKAVLRQAIQANPGQPEPYWEMSRILTSEGKYAEAAEILNNLILMDASQILAYAELVELYLKLNKPLDAHINLESYRKVAPMDTQRIESMQQRINMAMSKLVNTP
jgi:tetratricopeptide (TPR) repeat protein